MTALTLCVALLAADPLAAGDHVRKLQVDGRERSYLLHVPPRYDAQRPTPVVLVLHGAATNGAFTVKMTGMHAKSDAAGFLAVYPNGTGFGTFLTWNAGGLWKDSDAKRPDDVKFVAAVLDDLESVANVDPQRVFATGLSNGGMMCYRLAAELSDRIAAIAPVAGTMAIDDPQPKRPVPVMHFHGTDDRIVPFARPERRVPAFVRFKSVTESVEAWRTLNECPAAAETVDLPDAVADDTTVKRTTYGPGKDGSEVVLIEVVGGGHTWPGQKPVVGFIGRSTFDVSANDLMWEFFERHPKK